MTAQVAANSGSLSAVGTAAKAFIVSHPVGLAATGGALLGIGAYYAANKYLFKKKDSTVVTEQAATA